MTQLFRVALLLLISLLISPSLAVYSESDLAQTILDNMSPAERVGQLFIVSFVGEDTTSSSQIVQLIQEERVGGVVFLSANQNFTNEHDAPYQVRNLSQKLQARALESSQLPLLIAIDHEGDGWPYTRLRKGVTPLPSPMAIGATWNTKLSHDVGRVTGKELAAAGINLIFGPSIDVLNTPRPTTKGDLGTRVFGGDPYWVGKMGRAYIAGVHEGSNRRLATVAKHFPGHGGSDRLPDDEVATVDKSLQELSRIELAPFFAVTRFDEPDDMAVTDALMSSHIRYRGFQGNIRQFTAPISFDAQGLRIILAEKEFLDWSRQGLIVSDSLGVPAVKKYYDITGETFPHRQIARDALMAGNDLLVLAQFALEDHYEPQFTNMRDTMRYFRQQYERDALFAKRVDEAAMRVIRLKLKLYPEFEDENATLPPLPEPRFGLDTLVTQEVAEQAVSLIFPRTLEELNDRLPSRPRRGEPIVIFTDARLVHDCFDCSYYPLLPSDSLERAILRRYGPEGTNQIPETQIISFSFDDLKLFLGVPGALEASQDRQAAQERAEVVRATVERATWILIAMQDINLSPTVATQSARYPESDAARLLLDAAAGSLFNKRVVLFAFNIPYQLDTTEITKLTAFFALYSKQEAFIDVAARVLFKDLVPQGAPPITVDAANYDLPTQLEPDPKQKVILEGPEDDFLLIPTEIEVKTSLLLDRNGHPVPDGTSVEIIGSWQDNREARAPRVSTVTKDGKAQVMLRLAKEGILELNVEAMQSKSEQPLKLKLIGPTPTPTVTSEPTLTATATATATPSIIPTSSPSPLIPTATATISPPLSPSPSPSPPHQAISLSHFVVSLLSTITVVISTWWWTRTQSMIQQVRLGLFAIIGGMSSYLFWGTTFAAGGFIWVGPISLLGALVALGFAYFLPK